MDEDGSSISLLICLQNFLMDKCISFRTPLLTRQSKSDELLRKCAASTFSKSDRLSGLPESKKNTKI